MTEDVRQGLWLRLRDVGLVSGDLPATAERAPWFVRVMLGIGGWIGALFLLGFIGIGLAFVMDSAGAAFVVGAIACAAAAVLFRVGGDNDFIAQFGMAVSFAGQALLTFAVFDSARGPERFIALAVQQAVLFVLLSNYIHRVWAAWSSATALSYALHEMGAPWLVLPLLTGAFVIIWMYELERAEWGPLGRAAGYGLALAVITVAVTDGLSREPGEVARGMWLGGILQGAVLIAAVALLLSRETVPLTSDAAVASVATATGLGVLSMKAPGVGPCVSIVIMGQANGNPVLSGLGVASLLAYLSHYYYSLSATLLDKAMWLVAAGLVLLFVRAWLIRAVRRA